MQGQTSAKASTGTTTVLKAKVNASEAEKHQLQEAIGRTIHPTKSGLYGNLFVFDLAGSETTASSFTSQSCVPCRPLGHAGLDH